MSVLLRAGRREPTGVARCIALSALGIYIYRELANRTFHTKVPDAINVLLLALKVSSFSPLFLQIFRLFVISQFNNKLIAQLTSNILFLLCDFAPLLWQHHPRLADSVIRTLCGALFLHAPLGSTAGVTDKALGTALLLCLGEWCMRSGPAKLLEVSHYGDTREPSSCLLLQVFTVSYYIIYLFTKKNILFFIIKIKCRRL